MEQAWIAAIAIISFVLGATWATYWLPARLERKPKLRPANSSLGIIKQLNQASVQSDLPADPKTSEATFRPGSVHRRPGIAEMRKRAEEASRVPLDHQASITQKNTKALEQL